jgi:hypothetical protein
MNVWGVCSFLNKKREFVLEMWFVLLLKSLEEFCARGLVGVITSGYCSKVRATAGPRAVDIGAIT